MILSLCDEATVQAVLDSNQRPGFTPVVIIDHEDDDWPLDHPASAFTCAEGWVYYERAMQVA